MSARSTILTASAALALVVALPAAAQAASLERIDRSLFDAAPQVSASSWHFDGPTAGPLGGALDLVVTAADGSFPTAPGTCEPVNVHAILQVEPGEVLTVETTGEACAHPVDASLTVNAYFDRRDVTYSGTAHKKATVVGDGLIAAKSSWLGGQASVSAAVRW
jgi:hypothetical protein